MFCPIVSAPRPLTLWRCLEDDRVVSVRSIHSGPTPACEDLVTVQWGYNPANTWTERLDGFFDRFEPHL